MKPAIQYKYFYVW